MILHRQASPDVSVLATLAAPVTLTERFFGQHIQRYPRDGASAPPVRFGTVRSWDFFLLNGKRVLWKDIETTDGTWDFEAPDRWVEAHVGREMVIPLCGTPDWAVSAAALTGVNLAAYGGKSNQPPDSMAAWENYVGEMVTRYKGRVQYWQGWNEPNLPKFWAGAAATYTKLAEMQRRLYTIVKAIDPAAAVVSPSYTSVFSGVAGWRLFLAASDGAAATGAQWFDIAAYHFYNNDFSNRVSGLEMLSRSVRGAMQVAGVNKPIWATETGFIEPPLTSYSAAERLSLLRLYVYCLIVLGIERAIFYAYDDPVIGFNSGVLGVDSAAQMITAWNEMIERFVGRRVVGGSIVVSGQGRISARLEFLDGEVLSASYSGMP